ncbi:DUF1488 family protein [Roseateles sp.]|jgi:hypothetical protein|uniref:DUF1488 family protein n=1 Tax=Roseateles sp. TaxID=1971397 RepID=UPI0037CBA60B
MKQDAFFHTPSDAVRFWVQHGQQRVGASITSAVLHYHFCARSVDDQALDTYLAHADEIDAAVRRRLATGSLEPVLLREIDLLPPSDEPSSRLRP